MDCNGVITLFFSPSALDPIIIILFFKLFSYVFPKISVAGINLFLLKLEKLIRVLPSLSILWIKFLFFISKGIILYLTSVYLIKYEFDFCATLSSSDPKEGTINVLLSKVVRFEITGTFLTIPSTSIDEFINP